ncbi:MAG: hypothetical protein ACTSRS_22660 [Candidatus Helarchaeota archaeon]
MSNNTTDVEKISTKQKKFDGWVKEKDGWYYAPDGFAQNTIFPSKEFETFSRRSRTRWNLGEFFKDFRRNRKAR